MPAIVPLPVGRPVEPNVAVRKEALAVRGAGLELRPRRSRIATVAAFLTLASATALAATIGAKVNTKAKNKAWYRLLRKPSITPPDRVFGWVWTPLYALSVHSGFRVWRAPKSRARSVALAAWGAQTVFNGAWSWLFFGRHRPRLALADLAGNYAALGVYAAAAARVDRAAAVAVVPYLGWLTFAGALNAGIVRKRQLVGRR